MRNLPAWLDYISAQNWQTIDMGLSRMQVMVERMSLSRPAPQVITVAGTNGKGSTSLACEALLKSRGYLVGTTVSPHVRHFNERIRIDAREVDDQLICNAFSAVEAQRQDLPLTYFEYSALAALWCFQSAQVDVAILEIGLGGRLDAFNVVDADIAVITSIGLDHETFLGDSRDAIGVEKAGILRNHQRVVLGPDMPQSVRDACSALNLSPIVIGESYGFSWAAATPDKKASWSISHEGTVLACDLPMGSCAPQNLLLAYIAVHELCELPITCVADVAANLTPPGRLQMVNHEDRTWVLDVAHNPAAAEFLCQQLTMRDLMPQAIVCGMLRDKNHRGVFDIVSTASSAAWHLVDTAGERGMAAADLATQLPANVAAFSNWHTLIDEVNSATQPGDVILLFGSFNVIEQFDLVHESKT